MQLLGAAALVLGDFRCNAAYMDSAADARRRQGRRGQLSVILLSGDWGRMRRGEWEKVYAESEKAGCRVRETGEEYYALPASEHRCGGRAARRRRSGPQDGRSGSRPHAVRESPLPAA
ncbi:hypothetical protein JCM4814A_03310 [Streptomyces phaeofaciens JCM 4814]|uniref:Uncharacterized protein n=1 Tax=Streptomyces phaeofaciens TaxID=68254 RepID=A0A918HS53_9ACTN|nr:hypothetical protein GCM10010226_88990 [Streptomyces phaeofaciens]